MRNPHSFDPNKIGRYTVIRAHYHYSGENPGEKLFVALSHGQRGQVHFCWCIKATSQIEWYDNRPELLPGCVVYEAQQVSCFPLKTIIDPNNHLPMCHSTLQEAAKTGQYRIEGQMPEDFHTRLSVAIRRCDRLEPKKKAVLLACIGEAFTC